MHQKSLIFTKRLCRETDAAYNYFTVLVNLPLHLSLQSGLCAVHPTLTFKSCDDLQVDESTCAFEEIYCIAFRALDKKWLEMNASYMDFPVVMK